MAKEIIYTWDSKYLSGPSIEQFIKLQTKEQMFIIKATFSNFIKYALNAAPRDEQQQQFIEEIDEALETNDITQISVRSGHGTGKTNILSWLILYIGLTRNDSKIPTTAPVASQLTNILIPEVLKWSKKLFPKIRDKVKVLSEDVKFSNGNKCFARTARKENTEALAGVHAEFVLYIIDEASGIDQKIFDVIEGALTGDNYLLVMCSNPTRVTGTFYDSHTKNKEHYRTVHLDSEKSENVNQKWVQEMEGKYGRDSDTFRVRVNGEFPSSNVLSLFSMYDLYDASTRKAPDYSPVIWAVDVARHGDDDTILSKRSGNTIHPLTKIKSIRHKDAAKEIKVIYDMAKEKPLVINIDTTGGWGWGLYEDLQDLNIPVAAITFSDKSYIDGVFNKRAEMYWRLSENIGNITLPNDEKLMEDLSATTYYYNTNDEMMLTLKKKIKEELGRSPDRGDAVALLFVEDYVKIVKEEIKRPSQERRKMGGTSWAV